MPHAFIGVDVIVGTRGETEEFFRDAYHYIKGLDISQLHVFSYSERPGTKALQIPHIVSAEDKHQRSQALLDLSAKKMNDFYKRYVGTEALVLVEKSKRKGIMNGFTENYIKVEMKSALDLDNQIVRVCLGDYNEDKTALLAEIID